MGNRRGLALLLVVGLGACTPAQPTPVPSGGATNVVVNVNVGNTNGTTPSPAPGATLKPDYVKVTQFGETCPASVTAGPSGQDRGVRVGCSKAMTCSPKCKQASGLPDIDCQVPQGAAPDEFRVFSGQDRIFFTASSSNPAFNRDARGAAPGVALIDCTYAGVRSEPFELLVIP